MGTFKLNPEADLNGSCLRDHINVTASALTRAFGKPLDGYEEEEKGYDGQEWHFSSDDGRVFNVYARWGQWRIGARDDKLGLHPCATDDFKAWLLSQVA